MSDSKAVLAANAAFYRAFARRDAAAMTAAWSARASLTCIHPGWKPLHGRKAVLASWRRILANPDTPEIEMRKARAIVMDGAAYVICYEVVGDAVLAATNYFVREGTAWKVVHHQATPTTMAPPPRKPGATPTLH